MTPKRQTTPILVSDDGRYFVRPGGEPFFWLGDTQWELFRLFSLDDVQQILDSRAKLGFTCLQIMLVGVDPLENVEGQLPWHDGDPLRPNERYFEYVDKAIDLCRRCEGMVLVVGVYHTVRMKGQVNVANARLWARGVAQRYKDLPEIVWSMYPRAEEGDVPICRELARGLQEGDDGGHIITAHPDPSPGTSGTILHADDWLAFNSIQTFSDVDLIRSMVVEDYQRQPTKPVVMAEGAYEGGTEYGFDVTPLWLRRQAYYSYLAGGHHTYGHGFFWTLPPNWRDALDPPGARQMSLVKDALMARKEWWRLVPDQQLLAAGGRTEGRVLTLAARHPEGCWAVVYAGEATRLTVAMDGLGAGGEYEAFWIDPRTGKSGQRTAHAASGQQQFATPDGWEDALLVLELASG